MRALEGVRISPTEEIEHKVLATLLAWGLRCRADGDLHIVFSGEGGVVPPDPALRSGPAQ